MAYIGAMNASAMVSERVPSWMSRKLSLALQAQNGGRPTLVNGSVVQTMVYVMKKLPEGRWVVGIGNWRSHANAIFAMPRLALKSISYLPINVFCILTKIHLDRKICTRHITIMNTIR